MMLWSHLQLMTYPVKLEIKASVSTPQLASFLNLSPDYLCIFALLHFLGIETPSPFMDLPSPGPCFKLLLEGLSKTQYLGKRRC